MNTIVKVPTPDGTGYHFVEIKTQYPKFQTDVIYYRTRFKEGGPPGNDSATIIVSTLWKKSPVFSWYHVREQEFDVFEKNKEKALYHTSEYQKLQHENAIQTMKEILKN